jgi:hypothetical protein
MTPHRCKSCNTASNKRYIDSISLCEDLAKWIKRGEEHGGM